MPKLNVTDARRGEIWSINPEEIAADHEFNGRHYPVSDENVDAMVVSLRTHGQQQPVSVRLDREGKPHLISGFTRWLAALKIVQDDPQFKLRCTVVNCNEKDAFLKNVVENAHRNNTSHVDNAFNAERLRADYSYSDKEICDLIGFSITHLRKLDRILPMPEDMRLKIHSGELSLDAALTLWEIDDSGERQAMIDKLLEERQGEKISTRHVNAKIQEARDNNNGEPDDGEDEPESDEAPKASRAKLPKVKPTMAAVKALLDKCIGNNEFDSSHPAVAFLEALMAHLEGIKTERATEMAWKRLLKQTVMDE
jgi:ParB/RepB/Spo0J family partition protein